MFSLAYSCSTLAILIQLYIVSFDQSLVPTVNLIALRLMGAVAFAVTSTMQSLLQSFPDSGDAMTEELRYNWQTSAKNTTCHFSNPGSEL